MPWDDTLKCTTVEVMGGLAWSVMVVAFCTACAPVSDSISTEPRYHTLHAERHTEHTPVHQSVIIRVDKRSNVPNSVKKSVTDFLDIYLICFCFR